MTQQHQVKHILHLVHPEKRGIQVLHPESNGKYSVKAIKLFQLRFSSAVM